VVESLRDFKVGWKCFGPGVESFGQWSNLAACGQIVRPVAKSCGRWSNRAAGAAGGQIVWPAAKSFDQRSKREATARLFDHWSNRPV
jgi:hypothetical protein